jgi:hypothetical protein
MVFFCPNVLAHVVGLIKSHVQFEGQSSVIQHETPRSATPFRLLVADVTHHPLFLVGEYLHERY